MFARARLHARKDKSNTVDREAVRVRDTLDFDADVQQEGQGVLNPPSALELGLRRSSIEMGQGNVKGTFDVDDKGAAAALRDAGLLTDKTTKDFTSENVPNIIARNVADDITGVSAVDDDTTPDEPQPAAMSFVPANALSSGLKDRNNKNSTYGDSMGDYSVPDSGPSAPPSTAFTPIAFADDNARPPDAKYLWPDNSRPMLTLGMGLGIMICLIIFGAVVDAVIGQTEEFDYINNFHLIASSITGITIVGFLSLRIWLFPQGSTRGLIFEVTFFFAAFVFIQLLIYSRPNASTQSYEMAQSIKSTAFGPAFENIRTIDGYWNYIFSVFYPFLFPAGNAPGAATSGLWLFGKQAQLYGGFRLRQVRMPKDSCDNVSMQEMTRATQFCSSATVNCQIPTTCYGRYRSSGSISRETFMGSMGKEFPFTENTYVSTGGKVQSPFKRTSHSSRGEWSYPGSGHTTYIPLHYDDSNVKTFDMLTEMRNNNWIDAGTRAVFIEFGFASYVDMRFASVSAMVEFSAAGFVEAEPALVHSSFLTKNTGADSDWVIWYYPYLMFQVYMIAEVVIRIVYMGFKPVFTAAMTYIEFGNFAVCIAFLAYNFAAADYKPDMMQTVPLDPVFNSGSSASLPMDGPFYYQTAYMYVTAASILSIVCLMYWVKMITYLSIFPKLSFLTRIFSKVGGKLISFFLIFFILVIAFAQAFFMVFSTSLHDFLTTTLACYSMISALTGGLDIKPMFLEQPIYTIVYYVLFVCIMIFTMLTVILAIVHEDGYSKVADEMKREELRAARRGRTGPLGMVIAGLENYKKLHRADLKRDRAAAAQLPPKNV